jgi:hypothetical protein
MYDSHEESKKLPIGVLLHLNEINEWHYLNQGIVRSSSNPRDVSLLQTLQGLAKKNLCILEIDGNSWTAKKVGE